MRKLSTVIYALVAFFSLVLIVFGLVSFFAKDNPSNVSTLARVQKLEEIEKIKETKEVKLNGKIIVAEVARTQQQKAKGLMYRESMGENEGMLFVYNQPGIHKFWMKNTLIPLDMIWFDENFEIVHVETSVPPCTTAICPSYGPDKPSMYVLEVNGGWYE